MSITNMQKQMKKDKKKKSSANEKIILDLGCGQNKITLDYLLSTPLIEPTDNGNVKIKGVDIENTASADLVYDLKKFPYPFKAESIDGIFTSHFFEHLDGPTRVKFMEECYRILKPAGKMRFIHPYYKSIRAYQDPYHAWPPITEHSYLYFDRQWVKTNKLDHYGINCDFEFSIYYTWQDATMPTKADEARAFACDKYWNVIADLVVDLKKR